MDIQSIYDLTQHFVQAISTNPILGSAAHDLYETGRNITTALTQSDAMSVSDRFYHMSKLTVATLGLGFCAVTGSLPGAAGFAIPEVEEVRDLNRIGADYRATHTL